MIVPDRAACLLLAAILLLASVPIGSSTVISQPDAASAQDRSAIAAEELPDADTTVTRIELEDDGTAHWSVTIRTRLANESDVEEYEAFQEQFRDDRDAHVERFEERMTGVVSSAAESTERDMTATEFGAETSIQEVPRRWGTVTFSFRWTNFAVDDGAAVVVGDVFEGGLYLGDDDLLEIVPPDGYESTASSPPPDETDGSTVVWIGPEDFADRQPTVRFESAAAAESESTSAGETPDSSRWLSPPLVGAASLAVLALVGIAVAAVDRETLAGVGSRLPLPIGSSTSTPASTDDSDRSATEGAAGEDGRESETGSGSGSGSESGPESTAADPDSDAALASDPTLDDELVTDEDRVRRLLERNDGRMRQAAIAEELEWSASKTSRVVSGMAEDGTVDKLRVGRENVIDLVDESD